MRATPLRNSIDQPMRIARIAVYAYELSFAGHAFLFSRGRSVGRESSTLVQVTTDTGLSGWGEACPLTGSYLPAFTAGVRAAISLLAPALIGADPRNLAEVSARMDRVLLDQAAAKSPLDIACWDILGQATGLPVATLLGGRTVDRFPLYRAVPIGSPEEMLADVRAGWERGVRRFQLKAGRDPHTDAAAVRRILEFVGDDGVVVVDANGAWSVQDALIAVRLLEPLPDLSRTTLPDAGRMRPRPAGVRASDDLRRVRGRRSQSVRGCPGGRGRWREPEAREGWRADASQGPARPCPGPRHRLDDRRHLGRRRRDRRRQPSRGQH